MKICAVVVTYNRCELLKMCLEALERQTQKITEIIVINNCSNDNTEEYLNSVKDKDYISIINLEKNIGGAGGFNYGIKLAYEKDYDYIWVMDDDTIASPNALEKLINKLSVLEEKRVGFICSNVLYKDGKVCLMNVPGIDGIWNEKLTENLVRVESASFVSLLISNESIRKVGLPIKEFFIWGDDVEFTKRITKELDGYLSIDSQVYHYMKENKGVDIVNEDGDRLERYFYQFRNKFYISKKNGYKYIIKYIYFILKTSLNILLKSKNKFGKFKILVKGFANGIFFNPPIEYIEK